MITLKIGNNSFTFSKTYNEWTPASSFYIKNCESLLSIEIGADSFSYYTGEFELINCPALQSIKIGNMLIRDEDNHSYNFLYSSFVARGIN